jgi:hypothetical protein
MLGNENVNIMDKECKSQKVIRVTKSGQI